MKLKQTLPYKLKRVVPILGLAGASLFTACEKPVEPDPRHDTVHTWNHSEYDRIVRAFTYKDSAFSTLPQRVRASADSALVRNVILEFADTALLPTATYSNFASNIRHVIVDSILAPIAPENRAKVRGRGEIDALVLDLDQNDPDSIWLTDFGYTLTNVRYLSDFRKSNQR